MSRERVRALVSAACLTHKAKAERLDDVTADLDACETQRDGLLGEIRALQQPAPPRRSPWLLRAALVPAAVGVGVGGGICAGRCPNEVTVGLFVGSAALVVGRLVLQWVDDRAGRLP